MPEVYQIDLDEELLSHLAIPESVRLIWEEDLDQDLIEDDEVRQVFGWQTEHLRLEGKPATASALADRFDLDFDEPLVAIGDLIEKLRERYIRNNARSYMERISDAYKEDPAKVAEVLPLVAREISSKVGKRGEVYGTGDFDRSLQRYDESVLRGPGPSFGFEDVDRHFHGMKGLTFVIAPPKTYKSWIGAANIVVENVLNGKNIWLASLELPADETDMRIRCLAAGIPYWKYLRGSLNPQDRAMLREASTILDENGTYRSFKPEPGSRSIEDMAVRALDAGADCLIIDQLQYVETQQGKPLGTCDTREYWGPLNHARDLSDEIPIVLVHQFNRTVMFAEKMPEMQQAKGSAAIEETATLALGLWANKDMRRSNIVELGTLASRNYTYESWEIGIELSRGCNFEMIGRAVHDE